MKKTITFLKDEYWWGGAIADVHSMPYDKNSKEVINLAERTCLTQCAPLFVSSKGRYIWSDKGFISTFDNGVIICEGESEIFVNDKGSSLKDAYLNAKKERFPFSGDIETPREFYKYPQFNTWMEFVKDQTEENILRYAKELSENGYNKGILIIDDGWQEDHGIWRFNSSKFKDPKGMVEKLHKMGFLVMLWVAPWISPDSDAFLDLSRHEGIECDTGHLIRLPDGRVAIFKWWNGYSAMLDFNLKGDCEYMQNQLDVLVNEYGIDGFKFDGGDYVWKPLNGDDRFTASGKYGAAEDPMVYGWRTFDAKLHTTDELNAAWIKFGSKYRLHEFKNTWHVGHLPIIQRLGDKSHIWEKGGLASILPQGLFIGLIGSPFVCPDMVGGGSWVAFAYGKVDEELFVRMAECSALFPMMQFSALPWRKLSAPYADICLKMAKLHEKMYNEIIRVVEIAEKTGEPILRSMEYEFPHKGYEKIVDQFMMGDKYLVAPILQKGVTSRKVMFPEGKWQDMNDGKIYSGGEHVVNAPIDVLPYFVRLAD